MARSEAEDLSSALDGARLANMLPYLEAELLKMEEACVVRMDRLMVDGKLSPELAQVAWIEMLGYRRLRRRLSQRVQVGITIGARSAAVLSGEPPLPI